MNISSATIALPVSDLASAIAWYQRVFELEEPSAFPAPGLAEFVIGPIELQLSEEPVVRSGAEISVRCGVDDASAEHERLTSLGLRLGALEHVEGVVDYFDFTDPDGNPLSLYSLAP